MIAHSLVAHSLPIFDRGFRHEPLAWNNGRPLSRASCLSDAQALAERLPDRGFVINACANRYNFLVGFVAAMLREQVTLLLGDRNPNSLALLQQRYAGVYRLVEEAGLSSATTSLESVVVDAGGQEAIASVPTVSIPADRVVAIAFTSGTTGEPVPHPKQWRSLYATALLGARYLGMADTRLSIVATVPPQHMYGLEFSILVPLLTGASVCSEQPSLPSEIASALSSVPAPRFLVATPYQLQGLARLRPALPPLATIVSATSPLSSAMAKRLESLYATRVLEIYGFTEAGTVATRRTVAGSTWHYEPGLRFEPTAKGYLLHADHLDSPVPVHDSIELGPERSFELHGRGGDLIDVAGKRASLSGLNTILGEIDGVLDGAFFQPRPRTTEAVSRLVAIVVAPRLDARSIRQALRSRVDPAFLPRRIYHVDALPRSGASKLSRQDLAELARRLGVEDQC